MPEPVIPTTSDQQIWDAWLAAFHAPTLAIADDLGLFGALAAAPATSDELARTLAIELRAVEAIAGLLAALGFLARVDGRFVLADVARTYLLPDSPFYWGPLLRRVRDVPLDVKKLLDGLRRGRAGAEARVTGMWEAPKPPPEALVGFTHAMHAHSFALALRVLPTFGLTGRERLLDVGGGSGSYSIAAALLDRAAACTVLDLPPVCAVTRDYAARHGVGDRVATAPLDMFVDPWPPGHDRILMSDIFHDWDDERCRLLAQRAHAALAPGGRVLVHEMLLSDALDGPLAAAAYSMVMLFVAQGRQRSAHEIVTILASAGFAAPAVTLTANGYAVVAATRT
jgi:hypothetical protein